MEFRRGGGGGGGGKTDICIFMGGGGGKSALRKFLHIDVPRLHLVHSKQSTGILVSLDSILAYYRGAQDAF